jgi:hypothetical protein
MIQEQTRSATIYQFPIGGRDGLRQRPTSDVLPRAHVAVGESWYHAEAIQDAQRTKPQ